MVGISHILALIVAFVFKAALLVLLLRAARFLYRSWRNLGR